LVRQYSSAPIAESTEPPPPVPSYWIGRPQPLTKYAGMNRFVWDLRYAPIEGQEGGGFRFGKPKPSFALLNNEFGGLASEIDGADMAPTEAMRTAYHDYCQDLNTTLAQWDDLKSHDLTALNTQLTNAHLEPLPAPAAALSNPCGK